MTSCRCMDPQQIVFLLILGSALVLLVSEWIRLDLTAMLIVVLVTTLASAMVWQQWRAVQVEAAERARTQAAWILAGALDWARLILREDARSGSATTLNDPWATPLAEARLSSFLAADKAHTDEGPEAFHSGAIAAAPGELEVGLRQ